MSIFGKPPDPSKPPEPVAPGRPAPPAAPVFGGPRRASSPPRGRA
jgi:hypothetical protein